VPAFIYLCNMATEGECLDRMLFGTNAGDSYSALAVGDRVFLYNYELGILRGPFTATTKSTPQPRARRMEEVEGEVSLADSRRW